ncbi:MAG TPA: GAF domain-containing protein [Gaiellales bacterium]|jgi:hypothetical protein|nr:GAF domain-containing protein [Gaiellales bacterium]
MSTFASAEAVRRIEGLEMLLGRLGLCTSPAQAENLVAYAIPELVRAKWAVFYLSDDGGPPVVYGDDVWQELATVAFARGRACSTRNGDLETLAVPVYGGTGIVGVLVVAREGGFGDADLRVLRLFADRAAVALGRVSLAESA